MWSVAAQKGGGSASSLPLSPAWRRRHPSVVGRRVCLTVFLLLCGWLIPQQARANPTVPQGGSATFAKTGTTGPMTMPWDIINSAGATVASSSTPNGWTLSYNSGTMQFTVSAPSSAAIAANYTARDFFGMGVASASFDVVAGTLGLSSVSVSPSPVIGGNPSTGTVTLS